jgi:hypothetical protein
MHLAANEEGVDHEKALRSVSRDHGDRSVFPPRGYKSFIR